MRVFVVVDSLEFFQSHSLVLPVEWRKMDRDGCQGPPFLQGHLQLILGELFVLFKVGFPFSLG